MSPEPPYIYHGPYFGLIYASFGFWGIVRNTPYAWGAFAAVPPFTLVITDDGWFARASWPAV